MAAMESAGFRRKGERRRFPPLMMAGIAVTLLVAFAFGYHHGADCQYHRRLTEQRATAKTVRTSLEECQGQKIAILESRAKDDEMVQAEVAQLRRLEARLQQVQESNDALGAAREDCDATALTYEKRIAEQNEEDARLRAEVEAARRKVDQLRAAMLTETAGEGREGTLNRLALSALRRRYVARCNSVPGCVVRSNEELLEAFGQHTPNVTAAREELERLEGAMAMRMPPPLTPDSPNFTDVYMPASGAREEVSSAAGDPQALGRAVGQLLYRECKVKEKGDVEHDGLHTLSERLAAMQDASLCAYRHGDPNITFPSSFGHNTMSFTDAVEVWYLHKLFTTPYLTFTKWCDEAALQVELQRLACSDSRVRQHYGGHDFWAARSRLLPAKRVAAEAFNFFDAQEFVGKPTLAVVLRRPQNVECTTDHDRSRGQHYLYLRRAFPHDAALLKHVSNSSEEQCAPPVQGIVRFIADLDRASNASYVAIILAMPQDLRKDVLIAARETGDVGLVNRLQFYDPPPGTDPAHAELVEMEIASQASAIAVSQFLTPSQYVTERFLLQHGLRPDNRIFFF